jgi:DNA sulfur modification protein DndB
MKTKMILPCLRGVTGSWVYYTSLMSVAQINDWILSSKDIREAKSLDEILQRDLHDRKKKISKYLQNNDRRFFNSLIIGVFKGLPNWIEFDLSKTQKLVGSQDEFENLKESIGLLIFNGDEEMFAIDGQHRVAGIKIAYEEELKKKNAERVLTEDQFPVVFVAHIDDENGRKRTRKLFSDINKNAKPVAEGDKIKIDEEDLNAIVTRRLYANYKHFQKGKIISLTESARLEKNDITHFTNLLGINNTNKVLRKLYRKKPKTNDWDEENVLSFLKIVESFYNYAIANVKDYNDFFVKKSLSIKKARVDNKYLLFRPIGLKLVARLYVYYSLHDNGLDSLKKKINKLSFIMPKSPFNNILWNNGKMEAKETNQKLSYELALYLLGDLPKQQEKHLLKNYRELLKNEDIELPAKL